MKKFMGFLLITMLLTSVAGKAADRDNVSIVQIGGDAIKASSDLQHSVVINNLCIYDDAFLIQAISYDAYEIWEKIIIYQESKIPKTLKGYRNKIPIYKNQMFC